MLIRAIVLAIATLAGGVPQRPPHHVAMPPMQLTDARILGTLGAGDVDQMESAKLAMSKGSNKDVREYAKMMVHDHEASFKKNTEISKRMHIARMLPEDSLMARAHKQEMEQFNLLSGAEFDLAFLQAMVVDHATLIKDVTTVLLPGATRKDVKAFLREILPVLNVHQARAQALLDTRKKP